MENPSTRLQQHKHSTVTTAACHGSGTTDAQLTSSTEREGRHADVSCIIKFNLHHTFTSEQACTKHSALLVLAVSRSVQSFYIDLTETFLRDVGLCSLTD